jgi:TatD DNase family protein
MSLSTPEHSSNYWTDSHAHVYAREFAPDRADVLRRASELQVQKIFMPNVDHTSIDDMLEVESRYPTMCYATMGLHPCSVKKDFARELYIVESWLAKRKFAAIGEMGTDLYWDKTFWEQQKEAFAIQVGWAKQYGLPIIIHCRETLDETIAMIEQFQDGNLNGVFHCFTGSLEQAQKIIKLNFYLGIGGVSTFKNGGMDSVLPEVPIEKIILETDSPYLAPVPHRGKRNEPSYIPLIGRKVAELKKITNDELMKQTTVNTLHLFDQTVKL